MLEALATVTRALSRLFLVVAGAGLLVMTGIIGWQVFGRYVLNASPAWAEQLALVLMIWFITLAAAAGVREGFHIRITVLEDNLAEGGAKALRLASHAIVGLIGAAMAVWGAELVQATWHHNIPTLSIPRGAAYLPLPLSGALIVLFTVENLIAEILGRKVEPLWN